MSTEIRKLKKEGVQFYPQTHYKAVVGLLKALEDGEMIPALADNLTSWEEDYSEVRNSWDETIRTTAGDDPIVTKYGGILQSITAVEDFSCTSFTATPYNQLRLASNGGAAVALSSSAWYFPVPKLTLGEFGDATENNGILFTDSEGNNLQPTVRFVPLANGEPTSASAGTVISPTTVVYDDKTYKVYTTSGAGYLIVSGITQASTCAHIAWEDWYDRYVSPTDAEDVGTTINLAPLFTAAPNGSGKFLVLGSAGNIVATKAERADETHMKITDPIGRTAVTAASWTNTQNAAVEGETTTYTHSCTVSGMKSGGLAAIEDSDTILAIDGTTISYTDENATGMACTIRYEKATPSTATVTLAKTSYDLDDCGLEIKNGVIGSAYFECSYSQNVADALSQIAKVRFNVVLSVLAEAIASLHNEVKVLKDIVLTASYKTMDAEGYTCMGNPVVLTGTSAPSVTPKFVGQFYIDTTNSKVYIAKAVTNATGNWVILN